MVYHIFLKHLTVLLDFGYCVLKEKGVNVNIYCMIQSCDMQYVYILCCVLDSLETNILYIYKGELYTSNNSELMCKGEYII